MPFETTKEGNGVGAEKWKTADAPADPVAGGALSFAPVSPSRVRDMPDAKRNRGEPMPSVSGGSLNFSVSPAELFKFAVTVLMVGAMWWQIKSDLRDIQTTMAFQTQIQNDRFAAQAKLQDDRWTTQQDTNKQLNGKMEMQRITLDDIELALAKAGIYKRGGG